MRVGHVWRRSEGGFVANFAWKGMQRQLPLSMWRCSMYRPLSLTAVGLYGYAYAAMMPPIFMQSVRKQRADAQLHSQYLRATNC